MQRNNVRPYLHAGTGWCVIWCANTALFRASPPGLSSPATSMYHRGTFPEEHSPPPAHVFYRWPIGPPAPLSPLTARLPLPWNLPLPPPVPPLIHLPPSSPPPNVGVDLLGVTLLLVCVVNTLFTIIILYYTVRSLCHRRVKRPVPGGNYPPVSVLVPCYLPNEQVRTARTPPAHRPGTPHRARLASEVRLPQAWQGIIMSTIANPNPSPNPNPNPNPTSTPNSNLRASSWARSRTS